MKYTTAKTILKIYRKEGRFGKKKQRVKKGSGKQASSSGASEVPQEKPVSGGNSSTTNVMAPLDLNKDEGFNQAFNKALETTLTTSFWGSRIAEHFN